MNLQRKLEAIKLKRNVERQLEQFFEQKGFRAVEPNTFLGYEHFLRSNPKADTKDLVKVVSGNSEVLILRPDITANVLSEIFPAWDGNGQLNLYYNSVVFRNSRGSVVLENRQAGVESWGSECFDGEILAMAAAILARFDRPYILEVGSSQFIAGFFEELQLPTEVEALLKRLVASKNRHGVKAKMKEFGLEGIDLDMLFSLQGGMGEVLRKAGGHTLNSRMDRALGALEELHQWLLRKNPAALEQIELDLAMIPQQDYYDGVIFRGYSARCPGAIVQGGRYDGWTGIFGKQVPAIGFAVDVDLLIKMEMEGAKLA